MMKTSTRARILLGLTVYGLQVITKQQLAVYRGDFERFDVSGNEAIDGPEIKALAAFQLEKHIDAIDDQLLADFLAMMDTNADGKISYMEYMNALLGVGWAVESDLYGLLGAFSVKDPSGAVSFLHQEGRRRNV